MMSIYFLVVEWSMNVTHRLILSSLVSKDVLMQFRNHGVGTQNIVMCIYCQLSL